MIHKLKHTTFFILLTVFSLTLTNKLNAQQIEAQVSSKQVRVGEAFEYAIVVKTNVTNIVPPAFKDFEVAGGPNQSQSTQWVNGVVSSQITISWYLVPKKEGKLTIGSTAAYNGNQKMETNAITVEAIKGNGSSGNSQQSGSSQDDAKYNKVAGGDVFIRTGISKTKCLIGEQVTITQKVYSRYQIVGFQKFNPPTYNGFYSQAQESASNGQQVVENVDGVNYYTFELFRSVGIANQAGKINIEPIEGDVVVRKQTNAKPRNIFEQFFGGGGYEDIPVTAKSRLVTIDVTALPEDGKPASFNGAVGDYTFKADVNRNEIKANEAVNLKVTISGKGNLKLVDAPKFNLPEGFETYDPKVNEMASSKTFDYLIIPRTEGEYTLDNLEFSFFNLDTKKYVTLKAQPIKLNVLAPDPNAPGAQVYTPQNTIKETENDIRYIKKGNFELSKTENEFFNSFTHLLLMILPFLILVASLFFLKQHIKNNSNSILVKERKAAKLAKKQLVSAEKLMLQNKKDNFYTEVLLALNNYLSHKLNLPVADLSRENIEKLMLQKQITDITKQKLYSTLDSCEYAKYAPGAVSGDLKQVYNDTVELIATLEEQINKKA